MKTIRVLAIIVLGCAGYTGYWNWQYRRAGSEAAMFCDAVAIGADVTEVIARAHSAGVEGFRHGYRDDKRRYAVRFQGPIFNACSCELGLSEGRVLWRKVEWLDD